MSIQLVIAEKPSVARSIAGVIGANKKQDGYMEGNAGRRVSGQLVHRASGVLCRGWPVRRKILQMAV